MKNRNVMGIGMAIGMMVMMLMSAAPAMAAHIPMNAPGLQDGDYTYEIDGNDDATITDYTGTGGALNIPATLGGYDVVAIGSEAFHNLIGDNRALTSVVIPNSVLAIGYNAFYGAGITSLDLGTGVITIGEGAFTYSTLTSLTLPNSVTTLIDWSFSDCPNLASITFGSGLITIGPYAFSNAPVESITIPSSVTNLSGLAFRGCASLTEYDVSASNLNYASDNGVLFNKAGTELLAYPMAKAGTSYTVPDGVTAIGRSAFQDCSQIESVSLPDGLTTIGSNAFTSSSITAITIPASVTEIGIYAFDTCADLTAFNVDASNTVFSSPDGVLCNTTTLLVYPAAKAATTYTIPSGITNIYPYAFYYANNLVSVTIPNSVTTLESDVFEECEALESVIIGSGITAIQFSAFYECHALTSISFGGLVAPTDVNEDWLYGEYPALLGHALAASDFPAPGQVWNGLTMGDYYVPEEEPEEPEGPEVVNITVGMITTTAYASYPNSFTDYITFVVPASTGYWNGSFYLNITGPMATSYAYSWAYTIGPAGLTVNRTFTFQPYHNGTYTYSLEAGSTSNNGTIAFIMPDDTSHVLNRGTAVYPVAQMQSTGIMGNSISINVSITMGPTDGLGNYTWHLILVAPNAATTHVYSNISFPYRSSTTTTIYQFTFTPDQHGTYTVSLQHSYVAGNLNIPSNNSFGDTVEVARSVYNEGFYVSYNVGSMTVGGNYVITINRINFEGEGDWHGYVTITLYNASLDVIVTEKVYFNMTDSDINENSTWTYAIAYLGTLTSVMDWTKTSGTAEFNDGTTESHIFSVSAVAVPSSISETLNGVVVGMMLLVFVLVICLVLINVTGRFKK